MANRGELAVIGDVHANAAALTALLPLLERRHIEHLVILGDLLTYGCQPAETLSELDRLRSRFPITLLIGNHDRYYQDDSAAMTREISALPEWIKESIHWTKEQIDLGLFRKLPWTKDLFFNDVFFHHASPFGEYRWDYLSETGIIRKALATLRDDNKTVGVFGHTHRPLLARFRTDGVFLQSPWQEAVLTKGPWILNPGSLGQPRDRDRVSRVMTMSFQNAGIVCQLMPIQYDLHPFVGAILSSSLSTATKDRLLSYFRA